MPFVLLVITFLLVFISQLIKNVLLVYSVFLRLCFKEIKIIFIKFLFKILKIRVYRILFIILSLT